MGWTLNSANLELLPIELDSATLESLTESQIEKYEQVNLVDVSDLVSFDKDIKEPVFVSGKLLKRILHNLPRHLVSRRAAISPFVSRAWHEFRTEHQFETGTYVPRNGKANTLDIVLAVTSAIDSPSAGVLIDLDTSAPRVTNEA